MIELSQSFQFDAAHTLQRSEASRRVHGHTYTAQIAVRGPIGNAGMVVDLERLHVLADHLRGLLDHQFLDEVPDLGPATLENLCLFIVRRSFERGVQLVEVVVHRPDGGRAAYRPTW